MYREFCVMQWNSISLFLAYTFMTSNLDYTIATLWVNSRKGSLNVKGMVLLGQNIGSSIAALLLVLLSLCCVSDSSLKGSAEENREHCNVIEITQYCSIRQWFTPLARWLVTHNLIKLLDYWKVLGRETGARRKADFIRTSGRSPPKMCLAANH